MQAIEVAFEIGVASMRKVSLVEGYLMMNHLGKCQWKNDLKWTSYRLHWIFSTLKAGALKENIFGVNKQKF